MKRSFLAFFLTLISSVSFANSGPFTTRVAFTTDRDGNNEIYTMNPNGTNATRLTNNPAADTQAAFSLDGKRIAFTSARDGNNEIYVMNADGTGQTRLTDDPASDFQPTWSPDGLRIVFVSNRGGNFDLFSQFVGGLGGPQQITNDPGSDTDPTFSPKGDKMAFVSTRDGNAGIYTMSPDGFNQTRFTNTGSFEAHPRFSRNGDRITFSRFVQAGISFRPQVVAMHINGANASVLTSASSNSSPEFSADGNRIFFNSNRDGNNELYSMAIDGSNQVRLTNNTASDFGPSSLGVFEVETMAAYRPTLGQWTLATENNPNPVTFTVTFGQPGDLPVAGNWDGDTRTDIGVFRNGTFHLGMLRAGPLGTTIIETLPPIAFGQAGDLPLAGDWNGDGIDDIGVFRPGATGRFLLRQPVRVSAPFTGTVITTIAFDFGTAGDLPVAGDWNGDGKETPGVYRQGDPGEFLLTNSFANVIDFNFIFGSFDALPLTGDWLGLGRDGVGVFLPGSQVMILNPDPSGKGAFVFAFGQPGDLPVAGSWKP